MSARTRRGFTLIELLTVTAVIAVLSAILLPSVVHSQEQARLQNCKNNLKQLALAMHNYHDVHKTLPPGWVAPSWEADVGPAIGWQTMILPYIEQAPLYDQIDFNEPAAEENAKIFKSTVIELYRCPSDPTVNINPLRGKHATSNYSGNFGDLRLPGTIDTPQDGNGLFACNSRFRFRDVRDGLSNTFLIGERSLDSAAGIWMGVTANRNENDAVSDCSHDARLNASIESFSSKHAGGAHFAMGDGAVRFVPSDIDSQPELGVYQLLGNRNDSRPVPEF